MDFILFFFLGILKYFVEMLVFSGYDYFRSWVEMTRKFLDMEDILY